MDSRGVISPGEGVVAPFHDWLFLIPMKTNIAAAVRIKAEYGYHHGTLNAPKDGYLKTPCGSSPLEFETVQGAYDYLTADDGGHDAMCCGYDGDGTFSTSGVYVTSHGQHSRPRFTIVSAKSGRCTKAVIAACDACRA